MHAMRPAPPPPARSRSARRVPSPPAAWWRRRRAPPPSPPPGPPRPKRRGDPAAEDAYEGWAAGEAGTGGAGTDAWGVTQLDEGAVVDALYEVRETERGREAEQVGAAAARGGGG